MMEFMESVRRFLDTELFTISGTEVTPATLISAVAVLAGAWMASRILRKALGNALDKRGIRRRGGTAAVNRLVHYLVMLVGLGIAMETMGIRLSTLFAAGAIFAIGLGFAMRTIAENFVAGIMLLTERTITPGDIIEVNGVIVKVLEMGIRSTVVRTRDEEELIVPNAILVGNTIKNYTLKDSLYRLRALVGVTYGSDMKLVEKTLLEIGSRPEWQLTDRGPNIQMIEFGNSSVIWELSVWMENPWEARPVKSKLNDAIWWAFQEKGIVIAFPQLDVHLDAPVQEALASLGPREKR